MASELWGRKPWQLQCNDTRGTCDVTSLRHAGGASWMLARSARVASCQETACHSPEHYCSSCQMTCSKHNET